MSTGTHLEMHRQHQQWLQDALLWVDEAVLWMNANKNAAAELSPLAHELNRYAETIAVHQAETCAHTRAIQAHEHVLAQFEERGEEADIRTRSASSTASGRAQFEERGEEADILVFAKKHRAEAARHEQQRQTHATIKQRHHALMAEWIRLDRDATVIPTGTSGV